MSDSSGTSGTGGTGGNPPAGWYPSGEEPGAGHRWWDGSAWTEHTGGSPGDPAPGAGPAVDEATRVRQAPIDLDKEAGDGGTAYPTPGAGGGFPSAPGQPPYGAPQGQPGPFGAAGQGGQPGQPPYGAPQGQPGQPGQFGGPGMPGQPGQFGMAPGPSKKGPSKVLLGAIAGGVLLVVIIIVVLALTLGGGDDGGGGDSAQGTAEDFAAAISDGDIPAACELVDADSRDELLGDTDAESCADLEGESIPGLSDLPDGVSFTIEVGDITEDGDSATGDVSLSATYEGDDDTIRDQIESAPDTDGTIELTRESGSWFVSDFN